MRLLRLALLPLVLAAGPAVSPVLAATAAPALTAPFGLPAGGDALPSRKSGRCPSGESRVYKPGCGGV